MAPSAPTPPGTALSDFGRRNPSEIPFSPALSLILADRLFTQQSTGHES